jgi:hypothetical protein
MIWAPAGRPRLLFPVVLLDRLDEGQRATLLVHELAHVCRRDHWVRFVELVVSALYWWHPVVWWARREIHEAEEQCCDAWVVATFTDAGRAYALALLQTVAFFSQARVPLPAAASGIGQVSHLRRRLTMILQGKTPRSLSRLGWVAVCAAGLLLPLLPTHAQDKLPEKGKGGDQESVDQEIQALKRAIKILESQRAGQEKGEIILGPDKARIILKVQDLKKEQVDKAEPKANEALIQKYQAEVKKAMANVQQKRAELEKAERTLREAIGRLGKVGGANYVPVEIGTVRVQDYAPLVVSGKLVQPGQPLNLIKSGQPLNVKTLTPVVVTADGKTYRYEVVNKTVRVTDPKTDKAAVAKWVVTNPGQRVDDLEKKLDKLMKEVEMLRLELQKSRGQPYRGQKE